MILTIRTDKPEAEVGLYFRAGQERQYIKWQAHRQLAETIHKKIDYILKAEDKNWQSITGIICYAGPGSFTGLRIGISVANAIAYSLGVPIISGMGDDWIKEGIKRLSAGSNENLVVPKYGSVPHITTPKH